jgi:hypothetical protein
LGVLTRRSAACAVVRPVAASAAQQRRLQLNRKHGKQILDLAVRDALAEHFQRACDMPRGTHRQSPSYETVVAYEADSGE